MFSGNTAPWLIVQAWDDDQSPKTDLDASTAGLTASVVRPGLANVSIASFSDATGPTDWAAGKIHQIGGNIYAIGVSTASISGAAGYMAGVAGSYTGGTLVPVMVEVSAYNPTGNPNTTAPATPLNVTDARDSVLAKLPETGRALNLNESRAVINEELEDEKLAIIDLHTNRLTAGRAAKLENLDVAISVIQSQVTALNNLSAKANWFGALLLEVPDSGTRAYQFELVIKDDEDALVNLDALPTITLTNAAGTDRSALITTGIANPATGRYTLTITVATATVNESLKLTASGTVSGSARYAVLAPQVVDYDSATQINTILNRIGTPTASVSEDIATVNAKFPINFSALGINGSGHLSRVTVTDAVTDRTEYGLTTAAIQAIGDAFLNHVLTKGDPGTIQRAFWILSKTQVAIEGKVLASGSNSATSFLTDLPIDDFAGQPLNFVSGALTGQSRPIMSTSSAVVTVERAYTTTPSADDEFVIKSSLVQLINWSQLGLARTGADGDTLETLSDQLDSVGGGSGGSGTATLENQQSILTLLGSISGASLSAATWTPGIISGLPSSITQSDSYTTTVGRAVRVYYRDAEDNPVGSIGALNMTDPEFSASCIISQGSSSARCVGVCTWIDPPSGEDYLQIQFPRDQTRRLSAGSAVLQLKFHWSSSHEVEVAAQEILIRPNL